MLYESLRRGAERYHAHPEGWDKFYISYMQDKRQHLWDSCAVDEIEAARLILFLNQWATHCQAKAQELSCALNSVLPMLNLLADQDLLHIDVETGIVAGERISDMIATSFDALAQCGNRFESTGASKILHMINPRLFVMWDMGIRKALGGAFRRDGLSYATWFLPEMQRLARMAVDECMRDLGFSEGDAVAFICQCGHPLAKVIDEYNWATYVGSASGLDNEGETRSVCSPPADPGVDHAPPTDESAVVARITERLRLAGGSAVVPLVKRGKSFRATLRSGGVAVDNLGTQGFLPWVVFTEAVALLDRKGGRVRRGDAMNYRLGEPRLSLDSVEGHIAGVVYGIRPGSSVFRRISPIAALLVWAGICEHLPGELVLVK